MKIELNIDENKIIDSEYLSEVLANKIYKKHTDSFNEFDSELLEALRTTVSQIVNEYMKEYSGRDKVEIEIQHVLDNMTKEEILKAMLNK